MAEETSKTGLWLDGEGNLVTTQPKGGAKQIVREGGRITTAARTRLDAIEAEKSGDSKSEKDLTVTTEDFESAAAPDVEQAADTSKPARKTSK